MSDSIGPYQIIDRIGEGGMGVVHLGQNTNTGERVAVKTARLESRHALSSLRSEIEALARIEHASIVRIVGHGAQDGMPWYAMEYLEGETWEDYKLTLWPPPVMDTRTGGSSGSGPQAFDATVPRRGRSGPQTPAPTPSDTEEDYAFESTIRYGRAAEPGARSPAAAGQLDQVLSLGRKLCTALTVLHDAGFVHRDLKPANVFVVDDRPVLTDLGIASRFRGAVGRERIEVSGRLIGTVRYMSPEQAQGLLVDARADLYSLGMMLYETIAGRLPFSATTVDGWLAAILNDEPPPMSTFVDDVPERLEDLVSALLHREPRERIGHADDVARMLEKLGAEPDPLAPESTRTYLYRAEMAGRESQRLALEQALGRMQMGVGEMVVIGGESGVGKTVLATELARAATLRGIGVVTGECLPIALGAYTAIDVQSAPLHPLRPLLEHATDLCQVGEADKTAELLADGRGKLLSAYEPSLSQLPGVLEQTVPKLPGELAHHRLLKAVRDLLAALIEDTGPLVLLLDDLQWADEVTLSVLSALVEGELSSMRLLIVGTYRSDEVQPNLQTLTERRGVRKIELDRLDAVSVGSMVSDMLAMRRPPPGFVTFLTKQSEGNPFFVAEYLRLAVSEGLLHREQGRWRFEVDGDTEEAYARLSLPATLKELVARRFSGLSKRARTIMEVISVLGRETHRGLVQAILHEENDELDAGLEELVVRHVLEAEGGQFRFAHDKLRENAYAALDDTRRRELNRAAAVAVEEDARESNEPLDHGRLAQFWSEAQAWPNAIDAFERAAESALREYANDLAIRTFDNLFEVCQRESIDVGATRRGQWERGLADAQFALGRDFQGRRHIEKALAHFGQPDLPKGAVAQGFAMLRSILLLMAQGWLRPFFRVKPGLDRVRTGEAAHAYNKLLEHMLRNNETVLAVYANFRNVALAERVPAAPALARGYAMLSYVACLTPLQGVAARWAKRARDVADGLESPATIVYVQARTMAYQITVGQWEAADAGYTDAIELAKAISDRKQEEETYLTHSVGLYIQGRFRERLDVLQSCLASAAERGDSRFEGFARSGIAECNVRLGRKAQVEAEREAVEQWTGGEREQSEAIWGHAAAAIAAMHTHDERTARAQADSALSLMRQTPPQVFLLTPALWELAELYLGLAERTADASDADSVLLRAHLEEIVTILGKFSALIRAARPYAKIAAGGLAWRKGRTSKAIKLWQEGLELAEQMQARHAEARAAYDLGRHLEGPDRARYLDRAVLLFEDIGANPEAALAREAQSTGRLAV